MYKNATLNLFAKIYGWIILAGSNLQSLFLLWMRLTWGHQFIITGSYKLANIAQATQNFTNFGILHPKFHVYLVGYAELIGGTLLILGFASRLISIPLIIIMITALSTAHIENISHFRFITDPSSLVHEAPYPYLITALLIFIFGPGRISLDAWIKRWVHRQPKY